jgi:hypothetical protein
MGPWGPHWRHPRDMPIQRAGHFRRFVGVLAALVAVPTVFVLIGLWWGQDVAVTALWITGLGGLGAIVLGVVLLTVWVVTE